MTTKYFTAEPQLNLNAVEPSKNAALTIAYRTYGSPDRPAVLMPTCYLGTLDDTLTFLLSTGADGKPPVLASYFVIICGLLGGGESSSPSNAHPSMRGADFPEISYEDNIRRQYSLCQALGVRKLAAYVGFSMGGQQAYHMATIYPDFVERAVVIASSARTSWHNWCFLEGPKAALVNSADWNDGHYTKPVVKGTRAFSRVYSTWALSPEWYRERTWETRGYKTLQDYLEDYWDGGQDAHDLLCMLHTWQKGDISLHVTQKGDLPAALASIKAKMLIMPVRTDCYFLHQDSEEEVKHLRHGELRIIESAWGHLAGGGSGTEDDNQFIIKEVSRWLEQ